MNIAIPSLTMIIENSWANLDFIVAKETEEAIARLASDRRHQVFV